MADDSDEVAWPPAKLAAQFQEAGETVADAQLRLLRGLLAAGGGPGVGVGEGSGPAADVQGLDGVTGMEAMSRGAAAVSREAAVFKTRVQRGGRISIPDAEREALGIDDGDIVQTVVVPVPNDGRRDRDPER